MSFSKVFRNKGLILKGSIINNNLEETLDFIFDSAILAFVIVL